MAEVQTEIQLFDKLLFTKIFQSFRIAIHPSKMIIAFLAIAVISACGVLMDLTRSVVTTSDGKVTELTVYMQEPSALAEFIELNKDNGQGVGVFSTMWKHGAKQFEKTVDSVLNGRFGAAIRDIADYFYAVGWSFKYHFWYSIIFAAIKLVVICVAGGAICRISALQFAHGEKPGISEALRYSTKKFVSFLAAPLAPIAISICLGLCIFLLGLLGNIPYAGEIIVAILFALALITGIVITIVLILTGAGFNLMFPALAYDGLDCFDAISRSFNYVYSRPWRMAIYTALAAVYGAICYMFVRFFAFLLLLVTRFLLSLGLFGKGEQKFNVIWPQPQFQDLSGSALEATSNGTEWFAALVIYIFILIILGLVVAFIMSFYFSANTIIYALLRNKVDNTPIDEICRGPVSSEIGAADKQEKDDDSQTEPDDTGQ
jgi:hypothetical protein